MRECHNGRMRLDAENIDAAAAEDDFSGVVTLDIGDDRVFERAYGWAHRGYGARNTPGTQFAIASGSKGFTALAIMCLVERDSLQLAAPVRQILGSDLPLIDDAVTIEQLLGHTSGIGDYIDEDADGDITDYVLTVPSHTLTTAEAFLPLLDGFAQKFPPGERFGYCNSGFMVLAIVIERLTGKPFHDVVQELVIEPAGLPETAYLRLDELPGTAATGYLYGEGDQVNTLHLPVRGNGDGGAFTTAADLHTFWRALFRGAIVSEETLRTMIRPRSDVPDEGMRYGLGFWLHETGSGVILEGYDAGVSFRTTHLPETQTTASVLGNTSEGAWPVIGAVAETL